VVQVQVQQQMPKQQQGDGDRDGPNYQCYNDMPPPDISSSSSSSSSSNSDGGAPADARVGTITSSPTSATAASLASLAKLPGTAQGVLSLVPFLTARQGRRGLVHGVETSGWMTGFMLEGLYTAAGEVAEGVLPLAAAAAAVEYCYDTLTSEGSNSWLSMIKQNATMTMESWTQPPFAPGGGGTFSHPWTASPAWIIPRFLMGVRPADDGWRRVTVKPMPSLKLTSASIKIWTQRGLIGLAFETTTQSKSSKSAASASAAGVDASAEAPSFTATLTLPGNTAAEVCLPLYLFDFGSKCQVTVADQGVAATTAGALLCLDDNLWGGVHQIVMLCN